MSSNPLTTAQAFCLLCVLIGVISLAACQASMTPRATTAEIEQRDLPPLPRGAQAQSAIVQRVTVSELVTLDPSITVTKEHLAAMAREQVERQLSNSQQFALADSEAGNENQPVSFVIRGQVTRLYLGPEIEITGLEALTLQEGQGDNTQTVSRRMLSCTLQVQLVDRRTSPPRLVCSANGVAEMPIVIAYTTTTSGTQNGQAVNTVRTAKGGQFDQQHLSELLQVSANEAVASLLESANAKVFSPAGTQTPPARAEK